MVVAEDEVPVGVVLVDDEEEEEEEEEEDDVSTAVVGMGANGDLRRMTWPCMIT